MISIIVPVYKVEPYLKRCVDSILNQTFKDFKLILVDDGSPDNCGKICDEFAEKDKRIHVIHKANGGLSDARNAGIDWCFANSNSQWITFIDSDDWIHPRYLEALYNASQKYNSSISVCSYKKTEQYAECKDIEKFDVSLLDTNDLYIKYSTEAIVACMKLYKLSFFKDIRYPVGKVHEDEYVTYRLLFQNEKIAFVNEKLYFYFVNTSSIMNAKWSIKRLDAIEAFAQQYDYFKKTKNKIMFEFTVKKYVGILKYQYDNLIAYEDFCEKDYYLKLIRKQMAMCLRQKIVPFKNNKCMYKIAYPRLMKIQKFARRVQKKILRVLGNKEI